MLAKAIRFRDGFCDEFAAGKSEEQLKKFSRNWRDSQSEE